MKTEIVITILISLLLFSCSNYQQESISSIAVATLNTELLNAYKDSADWTSTPQAIAQHFFPPVSHDGGPRKYEIIKKELSDTELSVTVLEEGSIDDEVEGEKHVCI